MNKQKIIQILKGQKLDSWKIIFSENKRCSLFYTKNGELETGINSSGTQAAITIYKDYGKQIGDSSFEIYCDDEDKIKAQIKDALTLCALAKKPIYPMLQPTAASVELVDKKIVELFDNSEQEQQLFSIWKKLKEATPSGVRIAACELSLGLSKTEIVNSTGKSATSQRSKFFIECPITALKKGLELEYLATTTTLRLSDFNPTDFIECNSKLAKDVLLAENIKGSHSNIALSGDALRDFWSPDISTNPLVFHSSARAKYMDLSNFEKGKKIGVGFTVHSNPLIDYNPHSSAFDFDGTKSSKVTFVSRGKWNNMVASARYAHYLGVSVSGALGAIEVECEDTFDSLDGCVEIVSFSSFVPNGPSGDFSAEIRLAYLHKGKQKIPFRAGMFTGNIFSMLDKMKGSKQTGVMDGYKGPLTLRLDGATLSGV